MSDKSVVVTLWKAEVIDLKFQLKLLEDRGMIKDGMQLTFVKNGISPLFFSLRGGVPSQPTT